MGTYSSLTACLPNADGSGQLLVERRVGVPRGFKLVQYDTFNGEFNLFKLSRVSCKLRTEVLLQLPGHLMSRDTSPRFQKYIEEA